MPSAASVSLVDQLYQTILLRDAGTGEIDYWADQLDSGTLTQAQLIGDFVDSSEAQSYVLPIARLYQVFYQTAPDAAGLRLWVNTLRDAVTEGADPNAELGVIAADFAATSQFQSKYGAAASPLTFVTALYQNALGRGPDAGGLAYWVNQITTGQQTEAQVALGFANSAEFIADSANPIDTWLSAAGLSGTYTGDTSNGVINSLPGSTICTLSPIVQVINGGFTTVIADLTPASFNGIGPTLVAGDSIQNVTTLVINDSDAQAVDVLPAGVVLNNIQNIVLTTQGSAGGFMIPVFDVSSIAGLKNLTVTVFGSTNDTIRAGLSTAVDLNLNGPQPADAVVFGGSTVTVHALADNSSVYVGSLDENFSGINEFSTGNVTISNIDANGKFDGGTDFVELFGQKATTVSVIGASSFDIVDGATTSLAPSGTASSLDTVYLDGPGAGAIATNVGDLNLTVLDVSTYGNLTITDNAQDHELVLTVGDISVALQITDNLAGTIGVTDSAAGLFGIAASTGTITLNVPDATTISFANSAAQSFSLAGDTALTHISVNGAGALSLGDLSALPHLAKIDASGSTGAVSLTLNPAVTEFIGGVGNDTIAITSDGAGQIIAGGTGNNTLIADFDNSAGANIPASFGHNITGFDTLQIGLASSTSATNESEYAYDASEFTNLVVAGQTYNLTFADVAAGTPLQIIQSGAVAYQLATDTAEDSLSLTIGGANAVQVTLTSGGVGGTHGYGADANFDGIETINLTSDGAASNSILIADPATTSLAINAVSPLAVTGFLGNSLASIAVTGSAAVTTTGIYTYAPDGVTITDAGSGQLTATGAPLLSSNIYTVAGAFAVGDVISFGTISADTYTVKAADLGASNAITDDNIAANIVRIYNADASTIHPLARIYGAVGNEIYVPTSLGSVNSPVIPNFNIQGSGAVTVPISPAVAGIAAVNQVQDVALAGNFAAGDVITQSFYDVTSAVQGPSFSYIVTSADIGASSAVTDQNIATDLVNLINTSSFSAASTANGEFLITLAGANGGDRWTESIGNTSLGGTIEAVTITQPAPPVMEVDHLTVTGNWAIGDAVTISVNFASTTITLSAGDIKASAAATDAQVASDLAQAIGTLSANDFGATAIANNGVITLTAGNTNGFPLDPAVTVAYGNRISQTGTVQASPNDSISTGSGGGVITLGGGGSWSADQTVIADGNTYYGGYTAGSETVNLGASTGVSDTIIVPDGGIAMFNGTAGGISGFQATANSAADVISFQTAKTVITNVTDPLIVGSLTSLEGVSIEYYAGVLDRTGVLATLLPSVTYTALNGIIALNVIEPSITLTDLQKIEILSLIVDLSDVGAAIGASVIHGNTYIATSTYSTSLILAVPPLNNNASLIELIGASTLSGFSDDAGAQGAIRVTNITPQSAVASHVGNPAAIQIYNDAGYSADTLTATDAGATLTAFENLAPAAEVEVAGGGTVLNDLTILQTGAAGGNSLLLDLQNSDTLGVVTTKNDWSVHLNLEYSVNATIGSLIDSSHTVTALSITGNGNLTLGGADENGVMAGALKIIDASGDSGALTLYETQALTIKLGSGQDTITDNAPGVVFEHSGPYYNGSPIINAAGNRDVINLADFGASSLSLAGNGDTIYLFDAPGVLAGSLNGETPTSSLGSGDFIYLTTGQFIDSYSLWAGKNSLIVEQQTGSNPVNIGGETSVQVTADVVGGTSGTVVAGSATAPGIGLTTIAGFATPLPFSQLTLVFGNAPTEGWASGAVATSFVSESGAASLAKALDDAASQAPLLASNNASAQLNAQTGALDWFQYGGNTYIVEAINNGSSAAAHHALAAGDVVVELIGLVAVNNGNLVSTVFGQAHAG